MGVTVQWRGENEREPKRYGRAITFGNIRDKGSGYMSYSDRAGPGIVVLGGSHELCDRLTDGGFTALAPDLPEDPGTSARLVTAAIEHLADNWHPRVGVLAVGESRLFADDLGRNVDAVVVVTQEDDVDEELIDDFRYDLS